MENSCQIAQSQPYQEYVAWVGRISAEESQAKKQELIDGIFRSWEMVTIDKCNKYIDHLKKVVPRDIDLEGAATGY